MWGAKMTAAMVVSTAAFAAAPAAVAQRSQIDPSQRYLLLATERTGTMQTELSEAADQGFKVLAGSSMREGEIVLFLERVTQPPETYTYRVLATASTSTMEKELNNAAAEGFRLLPQTTMVQASAGRRILSGGLQVNEIVVVVERAPSVDKRYEYKLLAASATGTMQKEVSETVAAKFVLVAMVSRPGNIRNEHMVMMERQREP